MRAKDLNKLIPNKVRVTKNVTYEVLFTDEFLKDDKQLGECRPDTKQILLKNNQSSTEMMKTFLHEVFHAMSCENKDLNLTETQVRILEESTFRVLKLNKIFDKLV